MFFRALEIEGEREGIVALFRRPQAKIASRSDQSSLVAADASSGRDISPSGSGHERLPPKISINFAAAA